MVLALLSIPVSPAAMAADLRSRSRGLPREAKGPTVCDSLLSVPRVAEMLDISRRSVYRYIELGELSVVDLRTGNGRSRVRIPSRDVHEFVGRRTSTTSCRRSA
ncbi:helix-turn-helix domain-containing protein [Streptomyces sp. NPDC056632]|uniref:helix-turn-helix domain-containing protein n=1 Tax=Streptomyces sp. NPDC056632 TaxID=3345884 RepID=UPI0036CA5258